MVENKDSNDKKHKYLDTGIKHVTCLHCHEKFRTWPEFVEHRKTHDLEEHHRRKLETRPTEFLFINR